MGNFKLRQTLKTSTYLVAFVDINRCRTSTAELTQLGNLNCSIDVQGRCGKDAHPKNGKQEHAKCFHVESVALAYTKQLDRAERLYKIVQLNRMALWRFVLNCPFIFKQSVYPMCVCSTNYIKNWGNQQVAFGK